MTNNRNNQNETGTESLSDLGSLKKLSRRKLLSVAGTAAVAGMLFPRSVEGLTGHSNTVTGDVYGNQECEQQCSELLTLTVREFHERGVNFKSLGAVDDGITDNSAILNQALIDHVHVFVPPGKFVVKNMNIPSGSMISGIEGLSVLKAKNYNDVGQYVDSLFDIQSKENLIFSGITFDGGITSSAYVATDDKTKVRNLLRFRQSKHIRFENCTFTGFVSNTINAGVRVPGDFVRWHLATFEECDGVHFEGGQLINTFLEGISGYKTKNMTFDKFYSNNTRLSTPISAWYCDGFVLTNSDIREDVNRGSNAGSVLNIYSKNVRIQNNIIQGGTSIDFGNEAKDITLGGLFVQENVLFENNNVIGCINVIGPDDAHQLNRNVKIRNNFINASGFSRGINTGNCEDVTIEGNTINGADVAFTYSLNRINRLRIINNVVVDSYKICRFVVVGKDIKDVEIRDNKAITRTLSDIGGNGGFVVFSNSTNTTGTEVVENITIYNNNVKASGSWVYNYQTGTNRFKIKNMIIEGNTFDSLEGGTCERSLSPLYVDGLTIRNNRMFNSQKGNVFSICSDVKLEENEMSLINVSSVSYLYDFRDSCTGFVEATKNILVTGGTAISHFIIRTGASINRIRTQGNVPDTYAEAFKPSHFGPTINRPSDPKVVGFTYFDTTLNKPISWNGTTWVDSTGTGV
ncbi:hypothetical protein PV433_03790 [Paenibacillus sp. GYB004]|uniref:hypothetical protein n=1 Tax=Paenibacillus sp. GYB004 TaxID=2994393 RepID=UPI002F96A5A2